MGTMLRNHCFKCFLLHRKGRSDLCIQSLHLKLLKLIQTICMKMTEVFSPTAPTENLYTNMNMCNCLSHLILLLSLDAFIPWPRNIHFSVDPECTIFLNLNLGLLFSRLEEREK